MNKTGRPKTKKWTHIGNITEQWVKDSYPNASSTSKWKAQNIMNTFFEFLGTTDSQFVEGYKRAKDKHEWSKSIGFKVVAFCNERISQGYSVNTCRAEASTVRAFCRDNCTTLLLARKKIGKAREAHGEHNFQEKNFLKCSLSVMSVVRRFWQLQ